MIYVFAKLVFGWIFWLIWRPRIWNRKAMKIKGGAIFVCNHVSAWDPVLLAIISPRYIHYMAKMSLFKHPIGDFFFRQGLFAFPVNRGAGDVGSIKNALNLIMDGKVMGMFPEGTRNRTGAVLPFQKGAALLAERSGKPGVPIEIYPRSYKRERVLVAVGDPIMFDKREKGESLEEAAERMRLAVFSLTKHIPEVKLDEEADRSKA